VLNLDVGRLVERGKVEVPVVVAMAMATSRVPLRTREHVTIRHP
jgi:hypothetical protein